jgi:hypothetical protein
MKTTTPVRHHCRRLLVSATAYGIGAAVDTPRTLMSPVDYSVAKKMIEVKTHEPCAVPRPESHLRDICKAEARADGASARRSWRRSTGGTWLRAAERASRAPRRTTTSRKRVAATSVAKDKLIVPARRPAREGQGGRGRQLAST